MVCIEIERRTRFLKGQMLSICQWKITGLEGFLSSISVSPFLQRRTEQKGLCQVYPLFLRKRFFAPIHYFLWEVKSLRNGSPIPALSRFWMTRACCKRLRRRQVLRYLGKVHFGRTQSDLGKIPSSFLSLVLLSNQRRIIVACWISRSHSLLMKSR